MTITHYDSSSKGPVPIKFGEPEAMITPHIHRTIAMLERKGEQPEMVEALKAELQNPDRIENDARFAPAGGAPSSPAPAGSPAPMAIAYQLPTGPTVVDSFMSPAPAGGEGDIGHNNPPSFDVSLAEAYAPLKVETDRLIAEALQLTAVRTPEEHERAATLQRALTAVERAADQAHKREKDPLTVYTRKIDGYFLSAGIKGRVGPVKTKLATLDGDYLAAEAEKRRQAAIEAARAAQQEADARLAEAATAEEQGQHTIADIRAEGALAHEERAQQHMQTAAAPTQELARTYSSAGTSSLTQVLDWDIDQDTVDLEALRPFFHEDALKAALRAMVRARGWKGSECVGPNATRKVKGVTFKIVNKAGHR